MSDKPRTLVCAKCGVALIPLDRGEFWRPCAWPVEVGVCEREFFSGIGNNELPGGASGHYDIEEIDGKTH
jgi:hypothetical protein